VLQPTENGSPNSLSAVLIDKFDVTTVEIFETKLVVTTDLSVKVTDISIGGPVSGGPTDFVFGVIFFEKAL
jgi:hypothetical protein